MLIPHESIVPRQSPQSFTLMICSLSALPWTKWPRRSQGDPSQRDNRRWTRTLFNDSAMNNDIHNNIIAVDMMNRFPRRLLKQRMIESVSIMCLEVDIYMQARTFSRWGILRNKWKTAGWMEDSIKMDTAEKTCPQFCSYLKLKLPSAELVAVLIIFNWIISCKLYSSGTSSFPL